MSLGPPRPGAIMGKSLNGGDVVSLTELLSSFFFQLEGGWLNQPQAYLIASENANRVPRQPFQSCQLRLWAGPLPWCSTAAAEHCPPLPVAVWGHFGWH